MQLAVIHGSPRKGNTYKASHMILEELKKSGDVDVVEFHLPRDLPEFCTGCMACFLRGEDHCPHFNLVRPMTEAMRRADGIILTTPVYAMAESAQMKAFLDHHAFLFVSHRPMEEMFSKVGMVVASTIGAGIRHAVRPVRRSLRFWGIRRVISTGFSLFSLNLDDIPVRKRQRIERRLRRRARRFGRLLHRRHRLRSGLFTRIWFRISRKIQDSYDEDSVDRRYWKEKGWLDGSVRPF